jgi:hypothetical protein
MLAKALLFRGMIMEVRVPIGEVIPPAMLEANREHIVAFMLQEGIEPDPHDLGATVIGERKIKELLEELADELDQ